VLAEEEGSRVRTPTKTIIIDNLLLLQQQLRYRSVICYNFGELITACGTAFISAYVSCAPMAAPKATHPP
jgi:hypothetical protein